jgi:hypothetical protein
MYKSAFTLLIDMNMDNGTLITQKGNITFNLIYRMKLSFYYKSLDIMCYFYPS